MQAFEPVEYHEWLMIESDAIPPVLDDITPVQCWMVKARCWRLLKRGRRQRGHGEYVLTQGYREAFRPGSARWIPHYKGWSVHRLAMFPPLPDELESIQGRVRWALLDAPLYKTSKP